MRASAAVGLRGTTPGRRFVQVGMLGATPWSRTIVGALAGCVLLGACGGTDGGGTDGPGDGAVEVSGPSGTWTAHVFGPFAADREILGAPTGAGVAVLTVEEPGRVRPYLIDGDGEAEAVPFDGGASEFRTLTAVTSGPAGLVAMGTDPIPAHRNLVLRSEDGTAWAEASTTGLGTPMDVHGLTATSTAYVAVGALRTADDPSEGGFQPAIVTSADGLRWSQASTPAGTDGSVTAVASTGSGLLAVGHIHGAPFAWRSVDDGATWSAAPGVPDADRLAVSGDTVLAARSGLEGDGRVEIHRSGDGATTWDAVDTAFAEGFGSAELSGDSSGFSTLTSEAYRDPMFSPETCYADIDRCGPRDSADDEAAFVSADGRAWEPLDLTQLDGLFRPGAVVHDTSGDTIVLGTTEDGEWAAWVWDASQGAVPIGAATDDVPEYDGPPIVENGATLEEGRRYAFPLFIHCGMDRLGEFNGVQWELVESPTGDQPETGAGAPVPGDWPVVGQSILGYLTLVSEDRIEYSLEDGEVIGVYAPLPAGAEVLQCA